MTVAQGRPQILPPATAATQFKTGQSGNPKGRPKKAKTTKAGNVADMLREYLDKPVTVHEGSKTKKITLGEAALFRFVRQAAEGDQRAMKTLLAVVEKLGMLKPPEQSQQCGIVRMPAKPLTPEEFEAYYKLSNYFATPEDVDLMEKVILQRIAQHRVKAVERQKQREEFDAKYGNPGYTAPTNPRMS